MLEFSPETFLNPIWKALTKSERTLLYTLAVYAYPNSFGKYLVEGRSVTLLAENSGMDRHTVIDALFGLEEKKAIVTFFKTGKTNRYDLSAWALPEKTKTKL
jgi:hypothetical protein